MTKEQIDYIIEEFKNKNITKFSDFCENRFCSKCPMSRGEAISSCDYNSDEVIAELIERLLKAEEKKETNLEHYIIRNGVSIAREHDVEVWEFRFKKGTEKQFFDANIKSVLDWLLSPYDPPKYKLSQFEYDLIDSYFDTTTRRIKDFWALKNMQDKGYFKGIPTDISIKNILDNCEVVEDE